MTVKSLSRKEGRNNNPTLHAHGGNQKKPETYLYTRIAEWEKNMEKVWKKESIINTHQSLVEEKNNIHTHRGAYEVQIEIVDFDEDSAEK